jgi:tetratricopeptide (TPR) repeat protein
MTAQGVQDDRVAGPDAFGDVRSHACAVRRIGWAAFAAAALLVAGCGDGGESARRADEVEAALRADLDRAKKDAEKSDEALRRLREDVGTLREEVAALGARVVELEARPAAPAAGGDAAAGPKAAAPDPKAQAEEFRALMDKVFEGKATDAEEQRFWELARTTGRVGELMKDLEAKVKDAPNDVDARMNLAQAYIAKLLSIPGGPEQGVWSMKAEAQWKKVLEIDPNHWDARYSVAFNWSMWPDFLNKTPDAVKEFETLREIQERTSADPKHAQTYVQLSRLYLKQGKGDKAKEVLRAGAARHAQDAEIKKALESLED